MCPVTYKLLKMHKLLGLFLLVAVVVANDLEVGPVLGDKVFDQKLDASPALFWRQVKNVTVNATDGHVISRVVITDLRPAKDGEAVVVEGGQGQKNVTIELKSPAVLRGFEFNVEVYVVPENESAVIPPTSVTPEEEQEPKVPVLVADVSEDNLRNTRKTHEDGVTTEIVSEGTTTPALASQSTPVASTKLPEIDDGKTHFPVIGKEYEEPINRNKFPEEEADVVIPSAVENQPTHMNNSDTTGKSEKNPIVPEISGVNPPRDVLGAISTTENDATSTTTSYESTTQAVTSEDPVTYQFNKNEKPVDVIKPIGNQGLNPPKTIGSNDIAVNNHPAIVLPMPYNH